MRRIEVDPREPEEAELRPAVRALRDGELVAFPTETVYGLGARADEVGSVERIFRAKQRPPGHPLIVHVDGRGRAVRLADDWPEVAGALAERFWPGPLTLVVSRSASISDVVTGGLSTVGLRVPSHPVARALIEWAEVPVAAPSANPHTRLSPTRAEHVVEGLGDRVDLVVDAGSTQVGVESTVLSLAEERPTILRPGMIGREALCEVVGRVVYGDDVASPEEPRPAPGMAAKHYAPEAIVRVRSGAAMVEEFERASARTGVVAVGEWEGARPDRSDRVIELPREVEGYARGLYEALHRLDRLGCEEIWIERPPSGEEWRAVQDRLSRAAATG